MSTGRSELVFAGGGEARPLTVRRSGRARRMRLAVDPRDGRVLLTLPPRAALAPALAWVERQRGWVEAALAAVPPARGLAPGNSVPYEDVPHAIDWHPAYPRAVRRSGDRLQLGGPEELVAPRVLRWLKGQARAVLEAETRALGARAGVTIGRVRVGDPRSRWGSCSAGGDIAYSWRLILAPPPVREATVAHEVAHRLHMHHGPEFHAAAAALLGRDGKGERAWLRTHGAGLHAIGR